MSRRVATTRRRAPTRGAAPSPPARGLARLAPGALAPRGHRIADDLTLPIRSGSWRPAREIPSGVALGRHDRAGRGAILRASAHLDVPVGWPLFPVERPGVTFGDRPGELPPAHVRGDLDRYRIDLR
jgi:hypothetical protein